VGTTVREKDKRKWVEEEYVQSILYTCMKNRTTKPAEIVPRGGKGMIGSDRGDRFDQIHCMHIRKQHNETPVYN
jgi:hypothetical protein